MFSNFIECLMLTLRGSESKEHSLRRPVPHKRRIQAKRYSNCRDMSMDPKNIQRLYHSSLDSGSVVLNLALTMCHWVKCT